MLSPPWLFCASDMPAGVAVEGWNTFGWGWVVSGGMNGGLLSRQLLLLQLLRRVFCFHYGRNRNEAVICWASRTRRQVVKLPISCCYGRGLWGKWLRARNFAGRPV